LSTSETQGGPGGKRSPQVSLALNPGYELSGSAGHDNL
jgi:hypothetical protein